MSVNSETPQNSREGCLFWKTFQVNSITISLCTYQFDKIIMAFDMAAQKLISLSFS